jgi:hypothetical protein
MRHLVRTLSDPEVSDFGRSTKHGQPRAQPRSTEDAITPDEQKFDASTEPPKVREGHNLAFPDPGWRRSRQLENHRRLQQGGK